MCHINRVKHIGAFHNTTLVWFMLSKNLRDVSAKNFVACVLDSCLYCVMSDLVRVFDCGIQCVIQCVMNRI